MPRVTPKGMSGTSRAGVAGASQASATSVSSSCRSLLIAVSISLLLPDHDTRGPASSRSAGAIPTQAEPGHPDTLDPLHPVPGDGWAGFGGAGGSFRLDERRPPLHSHGAASRRCAGSPMPTRGQETVGELLLERLRRRPRAWPALHEGPSSDGRDTHLTPLPTMLLRAGLRSSSPGPSRSADRAGKRRATRLPAQQPPPPTSTRLKAAVFSKKRHPSPQRQPARSGDRKRVGQFRDQRRLRSISMEDRGATRDRHGTLQTHSCRR